MADIIPVDCIYTVTESSQVTLQAVVECAFVTLQTAPCFLICVDSLARVKPQCDSFGM